jgi:PTH1 family peptidyl-tRNA hydrolase
MSTIIAGLGNPGEKYEGTRHNTGRIMLLAFAKAHDLAYSAEGNTDRDGASDFSLNKKINALTAEATVGFGKKKEKVMLVMPETFMNNSGNSLKTLVTSPKKAEKLIVIYDDFNLPLGTIRISYNRSSGGHNGLESVIKAVKTEAFVRVRVGVAPASTKGEAKVPHGDDKIEKFILGKYKDDELKVIKKVAKTVTEAIEMIILEGREKTMSVMNGR